MDRWVGKVALVTGCSAGIGAAIAVDLVKKGMKVVAVARRVERIQELEGQLVNAPGTLYARKTDVSVEKDIYDLFQWIGQTLGTIHVLINNAGITRYGKLYDQNPKYWKQILDVNVMGLSICTQQALKLMKKSGVDDGHIIHINSIMGHAVQTGSNPKTGMYAASKYAVTAMTETLRQELRFLGSKIKVSSISPGIVRTEIGDAANEAAEEEHEKMPRFSAIPKDELPPMLESEDVSNAVLFVLSTPPHVQVHELIIKPIGEKV